MSQGMALCHLGLAIGQGIALIGREEKELTAGYRPANVSADYASGAVGRCFPAASTV